MTTTRKETGLLFKPEMIQALIEGRKTMTRRVIKMRDGSLMESEDLSNHIDGSFDKVMDFTKTFPYWVERKCPLGEVGDLIYVKETFQLMPELTKKYPERYVYRADNFGSDTDKWKSPLFMPKAAARIWLEITDIKVERLQDISEEDILAEGIKYNVNSTNAPKGFAYPFFKLGTENGALSFMPENWQQLSEKELSNKLLFAHWAELWCDINGRESWGANPFVWVIRFKTI